MRILYVAPYHVSGTLDLWQAEHRRRGHECRIVTLFRTPWRFEEDICLDLPLMPSNPLFISLRQALYHFTRSTLRDGSQIAERPPWWSPPGPLARAFFALRDRMIAPRVERAVREHGLDDFDIVWLDQGAGFYRDARRVARWADRGKHLLAFYHGSDMRSRGIYPQVDRHLDLRLTSEVDLLEMDERLEYLFLPFDTEAVTPAARRRVAEHVRIAHAARVRSYKGTERIVEVVNRLKRRYPVELVLIEGLPHEEAMALKATCDLSVDQIADTGGWGYGMSSVETLAMGIPTLTRMRPEMQAFVPDHPFVHVTGETLEEELAALIEDEPRRRELAERSREWVVRRHDIRNVADSLYGYFEREGWL